MEDIKVAAFSLRNYRFDKISMDFERGINKKIKIDFEPSAILKNENEIELTFVFSAFDPENLENVYVKIRCKALFKFTKVIEIDTIPEYFYVNSIAIIFPYVRSFVSTITLQANILPPLLLPTWNLQSLGKELKEHTTVAK